MFCVGGGWVAVSVTAECGGSDCASAGDGGGGVGVGDAGRVGVSLAGAVLAVRAVDGRGSGECLLFVLLRLCGGAWDEER